METGLGNLYGNIVANLFDNVSALKTVDIDLGQLKSGGVNLPMELPAAILKIENVVWEKHDAAKKLGTVHVRLRIIKPFINDEENYAAPHSVRSEVLDFFELIHEVREVLRAITSGYHTSLQLINEGHIKSTPESLQWTYCLDWFCNIYSDDSEIDEPGTIAVDFDNLLQHNNFFTRTDLSVVRIGEK